MEDKPKRPLSAYNFFFQSERCKLVQSTLGISRNAKSRKASGKIGFAGLARFVSAKWKHIHPDDRTKFELLAAKDRVRYDQEMVRWREDCRLAGERKKSALVHFSLSELERLHLTASTASSIVGYAHRWDESQSTLSFSRVDVVESNSLVSTQRIQDKTDINRYHSSSEWRRQMAHLASNLDDECVDLLVELFR